MSLYSLSIYILVLGWTISHVFTVNPTYTWNVFNVSNFSNSISGYELPNYRAIPNASDIVGGQPVYLSLTTIQSRLHHVPETVMSLLQGTLLPTKIFVFLSTEPFLLDTGVSYDSLLKGNWTKVISNPLVSVVFTDNIGPHRKLLPLLSSKWHEDCIIITVDDDEIYPKTALADLVAYYIESDRNSVVALRTRRMGLCSDAPPWRLAPYPRKGRWPIPAGGRQEMLMLPTGTGGVLYRPRFFDPVVFDERLRSLTVTGDDLTFRLGTIVKGTPVVAACTNGRYDLCPPKPRILTSEDPPRSRRRAYRPYRPRRQLREGQSLANDVNNKGRNDDMWEKACAYLLAQGIFDFSEVLQRYAPRERLQCMLHSTHKRVNGSSNILANFYERVQSTLQAVYDRRCGVQLCSD